MMRMVLNSLWWWMVYSKGQAPMTEFTLEQSSGEDFTVIYTEANSDWEAGNLPMVPKLVNFRVGTELSERTLTSTLYALTTLYATFVV